MQLFKVSKEVLNYHSSFNPEGIANLFPPEHDRRYPEALTFYDAVLKHVQKQKSLLDKMKILNDASHFLHGIKAESPEVFSSKINARLKEMERDRLAVKPLSER
jgi:hypothetical protein